MKILEETRGPAGSSERAALRQESESANWRRLGAGGREDVRGRTLQSMLTLAGQGAVAAQTARRWPTRERHMEVTAHLQLLEGPRVAKGLLDLGYCRE